MNMATSVVPAVQQTVPEWPLDANGVPEKESILWTAAGSAGAGHGSGEWHACTYTCMLTCLHRHTPHHTHVSRPPYTHMSTPHTHVHTTPHALPPQLPVQILLVCIHTNPYSAPSRRLKPITRRSCKSTWAAPMETNCTHAEEPFSKQVCIKLYIIVLVLTCDRQ